MDNPLYGICCCCTEIASSMYDIVFGCMVVRCLESDTWVRYCFIVLGRVPPRYWPSFQLHKSWPSFHDRWENIIRKVWICSSAASSEKPILNFQTRIIFLQPLVLRREQEFLNLNLQLQDNYENLSIQSEESLCWTARSIARMEVLFQVCRNNYCIFFLFQRALVMSK